jgi:hypothetical protein
MHFGISDLTKGQILSRGFYERRTARLAKLRSLLCHARRLGSLLAFVADFPSHRAPRENDSRDRWKRGQSVCAFPPRKHDATNATYRSLESDRCDRGARERNNRHLDPLLGRFPFVLLAHAAARHCSNSATSMPRTIDRFVRATPRTRMRRSILNPESFPCGASRQRYAPVMSL